MKKKTTKGLWISPDGLHYYFYSRRETNDSLVTLRLSKRGVWNKPSKGKETVRIEDNGNGAWIKGPVNVYLNYGDLTELYLALRVFMKDGNIGQSYKKVTLGRRNVRRKR